MGNRLSKIYTRTGDDGTTGLGNGDRVAKDSLRVEAYGTVDELNSTIGLILVEQRLPEPIVTGLRTIQHRLFDLGGELCIPGHAAITEAHVVQLETLLDSLNKDLPALKEFILPGGNRAAAVCHLARTVCRRAERRVCSLAAQEAVNEQAMHYLNRLSDLLFVIARSLNHATGDPETLWQPGLD